MRISNIDVIHHSDSIPVYDVINAMPEHNFIVVGNTANLVAHNCAFMDECNFSQAGVKDVKKAKKKMKETYDTLVTRVTGTFKHGGQVFGKAFDWTLQS